MPRMKVRNRWIMWAFCSVTAALVRLWLRTIRLRMISADGRDHPIEPRLGKGIYIFWHEAMLGALRRNGSARVLISNHTDGELISQICQSVGLGVVRGSTARGGNRALLDMIRSDDQTHLAIAPDGPRGPRRQVQPGIVLLASLTGMPIYAIGFGFSRAVRMNSWDRFAAPLPLSTITGVVSEALYIPPDLAREARETHRQHVETRLL